MALHPKSKIVALRALLAVIGTAFQRHAAQMRRVFSELSVEELRDFEMALKRVGKRAAALTERG